MPWAEETPMQQRQRFIEQFESCAYTMTELCEQFGISRKTGYKWAQRYVESGWEGLEDRSRAPRWIPHRTPARIEAALVALRRERPTWGPRKLLACLEREHPDWPWPAVSTAGEILKRHGLVVPRRTRQRFAVGKPFVDPCEPNAVWSVDFKGEFRLGNRQYCYPLTLLDSHSRYALGCQALDSTQGAGVRPVFEAAFEECGLPQAILHDGGPPFCAPQARRGLSKLAVWWIRLGIVPVRIQPGHPEQNGRHERFHRTLKAETTRPPEATLSAQQQRFDGFRDDYNRERPHEALAGLPPASCYQPSPRPYPQRLPSLEYPGHFEVRRVRNTGQVKWCRAPQGLLYVGQALRGEQVAFEEVDDGLWSLHFGPLLLGRWSDRDGCLY